MHITNIVVALVTCTMLQTVQLFAVRKCISTVHWPNVGVMLGHITPTADQCAVFQHGTILYNFPVPLSYNHHTSFEGLTKRTVYKLQDNKHVGPVKLESETLQAVFERCGRRHCLDRDIRTAW